MADSNQGVKSLECLTVPQSRECSKAEQQSLRAIRSESVKEAHAERAPSGQSNKANEVRLSYNSLKALARYL